MTRSTLALLAGVAVPLAGCAAATTDSSIGSQSTATVAKVTGQLIYRERIALPPNAKVEVLLTDITNGADKELVLARTQRTLNQGGPPIPFELNVSRVNASAGPLYGVRAFITAPDGKVLFRTTSPVLVNTRGPTAGEVGDILLYMGVPGEPGAAGIPNIRGALWTVEAIGSTPTKVEPKPTITFGVDGRAYGTGGCNNFSTTYKLDGSAITFEPVAANLRACEANVMQRESEFFTVFNNVKRARISESGLLVLETSTGERLYAQRSSRP